MHKELPTRATIMKTGSKIHLTRAQREETARQLRCIDHISLQLAHMTTPADVNIDALLAAFASLEGNELDTGEAARLSTSTTDAPQAQYLHRCRSAITDILTDKERNPIDEARVVSLHSFLFDNITDTPRPRRTIERLWSSNNRLRPTRIVVNSELRTLIEWMLPGNGAQELHPVTVAGIFIYELLAIHPFNEGKSTIAQLLAMQYLYNHGQKWIAQYAPARILAEKIAAYHHAIKSGMENRYTPQEDISEWIVLWTESVYRAACEASTLTAPALPKVSAAHRSYLNMRQRRILGYIEKNQPVKVGDIAAYLHKESINTIKKDLLLLRQEGYISAEGVLKGTVYYRN